MHDDDFELDFGEDELEFVQPAAAAAAAPVVEQQQQQQEQEQEDSSAALTSTPFSQPHPSTATSQESPVASTSTVKVTPREASSSSRGSSGAPGAWGRSLPRQQEYPSSNSSRRDGGRAQQGADDRYAPRPSPSSRPSASSTSRAAPATAPAPAPAPLLPTPTSTPSVAPVVARQESATPPPPPAPTAIHDETLDAHGRPLPAGWVSRVSKSTNQGYYYRNSVTNTSSWDNPNDAPLQVEEEPSPPPPAPSAPAPALAPVEQQQVAVEQEKPKRLAVHPDRLKLVGASASDSSSTVDSRTQPDGSRPEGSGLGSGVAVTSPSGFKRMSNEGRKALPPQQQAIPVNARPSGRKGARGSFGANAVDVNRLPLPTGPRADIKHVEAVAAAPAPPPPSGPRDPPAGPRNRIASTGTAGGMGDRWAVQVQGTGPKWAAKGGPGSRPAPTPPQQQPGVGPRAAAARSVAGAGAGLEGVPRGPAADVSRSNATAISANSSSNKEAAPTSTKPPPTGPSKPTINDRWAPRDRASAPPPIAPLAAPTGPRGTRLPVDSRALDDSLESYNAARPARSPSLTREVAPPPPVQTRSRRTSSPPRPPPPSAPTLVPTLNRDLPPHLRGSAPVPSPQQQHRQADPPAPVPSKRRSLSPPLGPSPLQKKRVAEERRAGGRIPGGAGGRGGPAITAANLAQLGPRKAFGGRAQEGEDAPRGRSPVREVVPPAPAPVSVNNWGARAARVPVATMQEAPVVERRREPQPEHRRRSPSPPPPRRASQYPEPKVLPSRSSRYRSPSSPPPPPPQRRRSFSPAPSSRRRSPSPQGQRRRYEASPPHAPPQAAYRDRSPPPRVAPRGRPRSRSRSPPPRRPLSPPRPGYSTSSNTSRRRSPSPLPHLQRHRSPSPPRHRYRDERSLSPPLRNGGWGDRAARYPGPMGPRRDPLPSVERWSLREGDLIDARTGRKVVPTPAASAPPPAPRGAGAGGRMRDWSTSPPPGNRGSHLRGKFRDDGREVPELRPYVPPEDPTPPPPVRERPRARTPPPPVATLPAGLPANPLKASSSTIRPGNERTNGHPPPPPPPAPSTSTAPPPTSSLLSRLSAAPGLPPRPSSTDGAPIHLSIKRAASAQGNRENGVEGKRRR